MKPREETTSADLQGALEAAEAELNLVSAQTKEAYRAYRKLDGQQTVIADEIRELKRRIREAE